MEPFRMRPRFKEKLPMDADALMSGIRRCLRSDGCPFVGTVLRRHATLTVRDDARHYWSPHLSLDVLQEEDGTKLRGRYAPHPSLWTGIMAGYAMLTMGAIGGLMYGTSQWLLGQAPWALLALPIVGALALVIYASAAVGQRLAEAQMEQLHTFLHECMARGLSQSTLLAVSAERPVDAQDADEAIQVG